MQTADDGLLADPSAEVLRALRHWSPVLPHLGLRLSQSSVAPAAGTLHQVDFRPFLALGCTICEDANYEVLKSPVGDDAFCQAYCLPRAAQQATTARLIGGIGDPQVAYYLLRWCCTGGRMDYLARTTPLRYSAAAMQAFDAALHDAFCAVTGFTLHGQTWKQAQLPVGSGSLGLRSAVDMADAAYIGSRVAVLDSCQALWASARWEGRALARCNRTASNRLLEISRITVCPRQLFLTDSILPTSLHGELRSAPMTSVASMRALRLRLRRC